MPGLLAVTWGCLRWVLFLQGKLDEAITLSRKSLVACRRLGTHARAGLTKAAAPKS
jgi:hypothetical protein